MKRKWFQLVGEDGKALTSADVVSVDMEDVVTFRKAVVKECPNNLANVDAADLTVFANGVALEEDSPIGSFGGTTKHALIVQVPQRRSGGGIVSAVSPGENERRFQKFNARIEHSKLEHQ